MFESRISKFVVVLFSLTVGGAFIWHSSRELSGDGEDTAGTPENEDRLDENSQQQPLMSGSKTRSAVVMEVDEAWELAMPPLEKKPDQEDRKNQEVKQ